MKNLKQGAGIILFVIDYQEVRCAPLPLPAEDVKISLMRTGRTKLKSGIGAVPSCCLMS